MKFKKLLAALFSVIGVNATAQQNSSPLNNSELENALAKHENEQTQQSHLNLLLALNKATYIVPSKDDGVTIDKKTGKPITESKFAFVLGSSPDGKPLFPLFTSYEELEKWSNAKHNSTWRLSAHDAWVFSKEFKMGVIINPISSGWVMGEDSISWLLAHE